MALLYALRHGETDWNAERRFQGRADRSVTAAGRAQAKASAAMLEREFARIGRSPAEFDFVASPLARAGETMAILTACMGAPAFAEEPDIVEIAFGAWEGMTTHEVKAAFPDERRRRKQDRWMFRPEGGESFADLEARVLQWFARLDRPTVACTHAGVIRVLARNCLDLDPDAAAALSVPHGQVFRVEAGRIEALPNPG